MNLSEFSVAVEERAALAGLEPPLNSALLFQYFELLRLWNNTINLTAFPLETPTSETFDRLLIEPLRAAVKLPDEPIRWFDLGSGGGSPAIPMKIARCRWHLHMVEAKERKAAFLREVVRSLRLPDAEVEAVRFETLLDKEQLEATVDLITARAVRLDSRFLQTCASLLKHGGLLVPFGFPGVDLVGFTHDSQSGFFRRVCST